MDLNQEPTHTRSRRRDYSLRRSEETLSPATLTAVSCGWGQSWMVRFGQVLRLRPRTPKLGSVCRTDDAGSSLNPRETAAVVWFTAPAAICRPPGRKCRMPRSPEIGTFRIGRQRLSRSTFQQTSRSRGGLMSGTSWKEHGDNQDGNHRLL